MKKLLIVDDEYIVRLGLKTIVDWAAFGYSVAGEAGNGKEALAFLEKNPVDLILADIKMPVMDGLLLTETIRARDKKVKIIILSHYDEFSYAQEAVKLGAFRYILKSELTKTNLEKVLKSLYLSSEDGAISGAVHGVSSGNADDQKTGWKAQWGAFIETSLLPVFVRGDEEADAGGNAGNKTAGPPSAEAPPGNNSRLIMFSASCRTTSLLNEAREKFPKTVQVLFEEAFGCAACKGRYGDDDFQFIAAVFTGEAADAAADTDKIEKSCIQIVKNLRQYYDVNMFIGVSTKGDCSFACRLIEEAHRARIACFFRTKEFTGIAGVHDIGLPYLSVKKSPVSYEKLAGFIEAGQKEAMLDYIQNIFQELREGKSYAAVHDVFIDFLSAGKLIHGKFRLEGKASLRETKFKRDVFYDLPFIGDAEMYIYELFLSLLSTKQDGKAHYSHIVKKCIDFIHSDYQHNIGLSEAAKRAGVSHSYLSFIFKQETGVNFNAALSQHRIEEAKKLLASTSLKIYQVAEKVGFSNPYYFSKVFKEISGSACREYRDRFSRF